LLSITDLTEKSREEVFTMRINCAELIAGPVNKMLAGQINQEQEV